MVLTSSKNVAVIGSGTMGHGIGQRFAQAGCQVVFQDLSESHLENATRNVKHNLEEMVELGLLTAKQSSATLNRIKTTVSLQEAAAEADLVVEAVFENLELKKGIFQKLDHLCPEKTIFASNTASLMPSILGEGIKRQDRLLVAHYFYPPHLMPLVELVRSKWTSDNTVDILRGLLESAGHVVVIMQKEAAGFIVNRLQYALFLEVFNLVEKGYATPQDIDLATKNSFGPRLAWAGPIEIMEVQAGWELIQQEATNILPDLKKSSDFPAVVQEKVAHGELGAKTGKGFYDWPAEKVQAWRKMMARNLMHRFFPSSSG